MLNVALPQAGAKAAESVTSGLSTPAASTPGAEQALRAEVGVPEGDMLVKQREKKARISSPDDDDDDAMDDGDKNPLSMSYSCRRSRFTRRMSRSDLHPLLAQKMLSKDGKNYLWKLFGACGENMDEMISCIMSTISEDSQKKSKVRAWTTRKDLIRELGEADAENVFSEAKKAKRWRPHPDA
jgi:hypothetical protein